jgi:amidase
MGRSVEDLALGLDVLAGPEADEARAWRLELPPARQRSLSEYRVAAWLDDPSCQVDGEVLTVLERAVDTLRSSGAKIDDAAPPGFTLTEGARVWERIVLAITGVGLPETVFELACAAAQSPAEPDEPFMMRSARAVSQRYREYASAVEARERLRAAWAEFFRDHDVLLCPVTCTAAFTHDHSDIVTGNRTLLVNGEPVDYLQATVWWAGMVGVCWLPSAVIPVGHTVSGLPVGVQIVGPYLEDRTVIDAAQRMSEILGGFRRPPQY